MFIQIPGGHAYIQQQCVLPRTCTSYVLNAYLYCVYALVGGIIHIFVPFHESVPTNRTLSSTGRLEGEEEGEGRRGRKVEGETSKYC